MVSFEIERIYMWKKESNNETFSKIVNSAVLLFNRYGYEGTSISSVVKQAKIARGSVYYYFENKDDLYLYCIRMCMRKFTKYMDENLQNTTYGLEAITENIKIRIRFFEDYPEYRTLFNCIISRKPNHLSKELIEIRVQLAEKNAEHLRGITHSMVLGKGVTDKDSVSFINLLQNNASFLLQEEFDEDKKHEQIELILHLSKIFINGLKVDII